MIFEPFIKVLTAEEVYGPSDKINKFVLAAEKGDFKPTGEFRPANHREYFIDPYGTVCQSFVPSSYLPRIILRKLEKRKVVKFIHTGIVRCIKKGEWFCDWSKSYMRWTHEWDSSDKYELVEQVEEEILA